MLILNLVYLALLSYLLIKSADHVVVAVHRLSKNSTSVAFLISALFIAMATSLPELFVGITSSLSNTPSLSLGNVIGANIANISLVAALATIYVGKVDVHQKFARKEIFVAGAAGLLPFFLIFIDGNLSRVDGLILISFYLAYTLSFFKDRFLAISDNLRQEHFFYKVFRKINHIDSKKGREVARLFLGVAALLFSANLLVGVAKNLASEIGVPVFLVGLIILSVGTTLPELAFSIKSLEDDEPTMFLGNILGSVIVNSTLIIGIAAAISPISDLVFNEYLIAFTAFVITYSLFWLFTKSKLTLERKEAVILFGIYLAFILFEFV